MGSNGAESPPGPKVYPANRTVVNDRSLIRDENYRTYTKRFEEASRFIPESLRALLHAESCSGEQRLPDLLVLGLAQASSHERFPKPLRHAHGIRATHSV
jgi:hypothetical protein